MSTFTWSHDRDPSGSTSFRTKSAQFGDGYKQSAPDGINSRSQKWSLTFTGTTAKISAIRAFLDARGGWEPFEWTTPLGEVGFFLASEYSATSLGHGIERVSVTFEQDFSP